MQPGAPAGKLLPLIERKIYSLVYIFITLMIIAGEQHLTGILPPYIDIQEQISSLPSNCTPVIIGHQLRRNLQRTAAAETVEKQVNHRRDEQRDGL